MEPILVDAEAAGDLLGVSRSTIYELLQAGELRDATVKVGRSRRFLVSELRAYAEGLHVARLEPADQ